jgi:hypothetical protein
MTSCDIRRMAPLTSYFAAWVIVPVRMVTARLVRRRRPRLPLGKRSVGHPLTGSVSVA